ncbi:unnamed protein product [Toxocara canis]|uniref:Uncharacterized protein n=1 Tax=Toxocara canis TaxID=6265 RepID=A0A183UQZ6_TOXCA|nr:unnamed protein product [Toxocara canis]
MSKSISIEIDDHIVLHHSHHIASHHPEQTPFLSTSIRNHASRPQPTMPHIAECISRHRLRLLESTTIAIRLHADQFPE